MGRLRRALRRVRGFGTPIGGLSWDRGSPEDEVAHAVVMFLEDRRVLYREVDREHPEHSIQSAMTIREYLTTQIEGLAPQSDLLTRLRSIRDACRAFCDEADEYLRLGGSGFLGLPKKIWIRGAGLG